MNSFFIFAGEASGDLHGSHLMNSLKAQLPSSSLSGVGGPLMRTKDFDCLLPMEAFQVMGFTDVLLHLPKLWSQFNLVRDTILKTQPDCVVLIDYPGFNLRLAKALRKRGFKGKIVQMVCPSVWAHGKDRIATMSQTLDLLLTIYPFEAALFSDTILPVRYIGNPLIERISTHTYNNQWKEHSRIPSDVVPIALFPGSREGEICRNLTVQLEAAKKLKSLHPKAHFAVSVGHDNLEPLINTLIRSSGLQLNHEVFLVSKAFSYELMRDCGAALAKSGTVTLELALHECPTVVTYVLSPLNHLVAKYILKLQLPHYCMVNILGGHEIFPELIGTNIDLTYLTAHLDRLYCDPDSRSIIKQECMRIRENLGDHNSSQLAVKAISELFP